MLLNSMSLSLQSCSSSPSSYLPENLPKLASPCWSCYKLPINKTHKTPLIFKSNQSLPINHFVKSIAQTIQTLKWKYHHYLNDDPGVDLIARSAGSTTVLQNGGLGLALLSVTTTAKVRLSPFLSTLAANPTFVSGVLAWFAAQSIKVVLNFFVERKWDLRVLFASGGMPSSHSALCTAITTSVGICHGAADALFPVCLGFSLIVMYDAIGVRRHAGMQAEVLNKIIEDLFQGHPISERKLKELLGHTPSQVVAGAVLGIMVACFCCQSCLFPV